MKKGKIFNLFAGIFDILFALALITLIVLSFAAPTIVLIKNIMGNTFIVFVAALSYIGLPITSLSQFQILSYVFIGVLGIIGLLSLIFGSVTIAKCRKESNKYYKRGSVITFAFFETIVLALFVSLLLLAPTMLELIIVTSVFGFIVLLRYIGLILLSCGRKKYISETPIA